MFLFKNSKILTHLNPVVGGVEEIATSDGVQHRIVPVIDDVVRRHGRQPLPLQREDTPLESNQLLFLQQIIPVRQSTAEKRTKTNSTQLKLVTATLPQANLVHPLSDLILNVADVISERFGDGVASQRFHVEIVGFRWENHEGHHRYLRMGRLEETGDKTWLNRPIYVPSSSGLT